MRKSDERREGSIKKMKNYMPQIQMARGGSIQACCHRWGWDGAVRTGGCNRAIDKIQGSSIESRGSLFFYEAKGLVWCEWLAGIWIVGTRCVCWTLGAPYCNFNYFPYQPLQFCISLLIFFFKSKHNQMLNTDSQRFK